MHLAMTMREENQSKQQMQKFIVEQEQIKLQVPSLLDGKKDWMVYAGSVKEKSKVAVTFLDELDESLTDDSELSFHVVEARAQAVQVHQMAAGMRWTGVFTPVTRFLAKGKLLREQYDTLNELIQHVIMLLGKADDVTRITRAM